MRYSLVHVFGIFNLALSLANVIVILNDPDESKDCPIINVRVKHIRGSIPSIVRMHRPKCDETRHENRFSSPPYLFPL